MSIRTTLQTSVLLSASLLTAFAVASGCDADSSASPSPEVGGNSGKADDADPGMTPDAAIDGDVCVIADGETDECACTYDEYDAGCGLECESDEDDCDKGVRGDAFLECAPAIASVAVSCGADGWGLVSSGLQQQTDAAWRAFLQLITNANCRWAVGQAVDCMFYKGLQASTIGIMWEYNACLATNTDCCTTQSMCDNRYGGVCDGGYCWH